MPLALTVTKLGGDEMDNSSFQDQLRQIESEVDLPLPISSS